MGGRKPGAPKVGGRVKGSLNKRTIAKLQEASNHIGAIKRQGQKKATEVLNELMQTSVSFAARYQQRILASTQQDKEPTKEDLDRFWKAMECAGTFARSLAPFQDPTFSAIKVSMPAAPMEGAVTLTQRENIVTINDPIALARVYQRMIKRIG